METHTSIIHEKISNNLIKIKRRIRQAAFISQRKLSAITIMAATKTVPTEAILSAHECGITNFGENYVQEAEKKKMALGLQTTDVEWHMIGHLQSNKVNKAVEIFDVIESVDSVSLAEAIAKKATTKPIPIMLEINISLESSKFGFYPEDLRTVYKKLKSLSELCITGLMTIAPQVSDTEKVRPFFRHLRKLNDELGLSELSMGMTNDFEIAIQEGATIIRLGRALFGPRPFVI